MLKQLLPEKIISCFLSKVYHIFVYVKSIHIQQHVTIYMLKAYMVLTVVIIVINCPLIFLCSQMEIHIGMDTQNIIKAE